MVLAPTLSLDGTPEDMSYDQSGKESLADAYEYVMYGKVFKKEDTDEGGLAKIFREHLLRRAPGAPQGGPEEPQGGRHR